MPEEFENISHIRLSARSAFRALFATLPPIKSFFESLIAARSR